jgi:hypothetical protein
MDLTAFISCSVDASKTLAIGDIDRRATRYVHVSRGIKCFALCHRPALLVTGGSDKIIRLWNPYVLDKRSGMLVGHNAGIEEIVMNHEAGHIISLAEDKVLHPLIMYSVIAGCQNLECPNAPVLADPVR